MQSLKILFVGNSFAVDTMEHTANIAKSLGIKDLKFCTLYVGGCSIDMHYEHAIKNLPTYKLYTNVGDGWSCEENYTISNAIALDNWDYVAIQHGTSGTSRYTSTICYKNLTPLINYIKERVSKNTKIAFNLTWMGESTFNHHEIISYNGDVATMRKNLVEVTKQMVVSNPLVDLLIPTGTAIENARTSKIGLLTRDGFHLSLDVGRFIAGLTLICKLTNLDINNIAWSPDGVDEYALNVAKESVINAINSPLTITTSKLVK